MTEEISVAYARFQQDGSIDGLTGIANRVPAAGVAAVERDVQITTHASTPCVPCPQPPDLELTVLARDAGAN